MADRLVNWEQVNKALEGLRDVVGSSRANNVVARSVAFAVNKSSPLHKTAVAFAPKRRDDSAGIKRTYKGNIKAPGFLSRNLGSKNVKFRSKAAGLANTFQSIYGPRSEAFYGTQFLERGRGKVGFRGPWLEPAFRATENQTLDRFSKRLATLIEKDRKKVRQ